MRNGRAFRIDWKCAACGDSGEWVWQAKMYCKQCYAEVRFGIIRPPPGPRTPELPPIHPEQDDLPEEYRD